MALVADYVLDAALAVFDTEANRLDVCSQEPATFLEATDTYSLGNKTSISVGAPTDNSTNGRKVTVAQITDGVITDDGTVSHWAITDTVNSRLLAAGMLAGLQGVSNGNIFTLAQFDIVFPDAA